MERVRLVHFDHCGVPTFTPSGIKNMLMFTDDYSRFTTAFLLIIVRNILFEILKDF